VIEDDETPEPPPVADDSAADFPDLLPGPVAPVDPVVRRGGRILVGLVVAVVLVAVGVAVGWLVRGEDTVVVPVDGPAVTVIAGEAPVDDPGAEPVVAVAEAVSPSVVLIEIPGVGQGSGIILDTAGFIVTNGHVIDDATEASVTLPNGHRVDAEVVGADIRRDVAVIRLVEEVEGLVPATFGRSDELQVGQLAVAVGSPFDLSQSVTAGIVSALGRVLPSYGCQVGGDTSPDCAGIAMIQTDAPINPGNSGGPLADRSGRVIGMNTAIRTDGVVEANAGVGFALPSDTVLVVAERLLAGEPVGTAWLGIRGESPSDGRAGAIIVELTEGSPADVAGLVVGDLIVTSDGRPIIAMDALRADIQLRLPGMTVDLGYERDGVPGVAHVELGALDEFLD